MLSVAALAGKFGGLFASLPQAMVSGLFCVMFSIIAAIGISQLQFVDLNSPRNIFIMGFGLYMSLSIQDYFTSYQAKNNAGPIATGNQSFNSEPDCLPCLLTSLCADHLCMPTQSRTHGRSDPSAYCSRRIRTDVGIV